MLFEGIVPKGIWEIERIERATGIRHFARGENAVLNYMPAYVSDAMCRAGAAEDAAAGIAVGTDTTAAVASQTDVISQVEWSAFDAGFPKNDYSTFTNYTAWQATWDGTETITSITEGCVKAFTTGTNAISRWMWTTATTKGTGDTLVVRLLWGYTT